MTKHSITLEPRKTLGHKVKALRHQGILPVNIYGKKTKSISAQINLQDFKKLYEKVKETNLVYVSLNNEKEERPCLISHIQLHPVTDIILHADFHQVDLTETVTAEIPVELKGEAPAVSLENATIITQISDIEVEALPTDLPEKFIIDISKLEKVGDSIKISDLKFNTDKIKVSLDPETIIVSAQAQQAEEVVEAPVSTDTPAEDETKKPTEEESKEPKETPAE
jgi:large subunit ribosomal protein L25